MIVGIPAEVKDNEYRVAATPEGVRELVHAGHSVVVQAGAGVGSALPDADFAAAGAEVLPDADAVFAAADMILKVKEPQPAEYDAVPRGADPVHVPPPGGRRGADAVPGGAHRWRRSRTRPCSSPDGRLPLLAPMSEIAGRMAPHCGASNLERPKGGRGVLMGGASGVAPAHVVVLGAGMAGTNAAWIAAGMEAEVAIVDKNVERLAVRRPDLARPDPDGHVQPARGRAAGDAGGPGDRRGARPRGEGAASGHGGHGRAHAAGRRDRGHLDRSGRLLRDVARDDALGPDVRGARRGPLLRREHAGRGAAHLDVRAHQRDASRTRSRSRTWGSRTRSAATPRWRSA